MKIKMRLKTIHSYVIFIHNDMTNEQFKIFCEEYADVVDITNELVPNGFKYHIYEIDNNMGIYKYNQTYICTPKEKSYFTKMSKAGIMGIGLKYTV